MNELSGFQVSGSAPENYERFNPVIMAPFIRAIVKEAALEPGDAVLDVACGTGLATRAAAEAAGASGRVAGLDLNAGMIAMARNTPCPPGAAPIEWHQGSVLDLPFADGEFAAVLCQQGIQFFPDIARAAREMARVAASNGRVAVSFFTALDEQTYLRAQLEGVRAAIGDGAAPIEVAFRLDPKVACGALTAAGFRDVEAHKVVATIALPPLEEFALGQLAALPVGPAIAALPQAQRRGYVECLQRALQPFRNAGGGHDCPIGSWVVTGTR